MSGTAAVIDKQQWCLPAIDQYLPTSPELSSGQRPAVIRGTTLNADLLSTASSLLLLSPLISGQSDHVTRVVPNRRRYRRRDCRRQESYILSVMLNITGVRQIGRPWQSKRRPIHRLMEFDRLVTRQGSLTAAYE